MLLYVVHMLLALALIVISTAIATSTLPKPLTEIKECTSIDIRNECDKMHLLDNCTVIIGYMMIALMPNTCTCDYTKYQFPRLREITEFVIFTEVRGMYSIRDMFPNLTVIRGRRLFLNYAMGITSMPDLKLLEFKSLVAIQRGHVYIGNCRSLCQLNKINWDRLTLSTGENHMVVASNNHCTTNATCKGCSSNYCWSNFTCQRFENDNVAYYDRDSHNCHEECLGGCYNTTAAGCVVCRGLTDAGVCVKKCPANKYLLEHYQRCYTRDECVKHHGHYTFGSDCVAFCPSGYKANAEFNCTRCGQDESCVSFCTPERNEGAFVIYNLADAEDMRGCQIVNSSLIITIRNQVDEVQLEQSLSSLREIRGHLKISGSSQLSSLKFLSNLQRIHGDPLENNQYALILYDNKQLADLWKPTEQLELVNGGMYMHRNNKLCNKHILDFQTNVLHDKKIDSLQTSDQEVLCGPIKLQLSVQVRNHRTVQLSWPRSQTSVEIELIYRSVPPGKLYIEPSELDVPICTRINWQRQLLFTDDLQENATHYSYMLKELKPHTRYGCLVRTFGGDGHHEARSDMIYVQTQADIPKAPTLIVTKKTDNSLTLGLSGQEHDYYVLTVIEMLDDGKYIDQRNYCKQPANLFQDMDAEHWRSLQSFDYDDCCPYQAELNEDSHFIDNMNAMYRCTMDAPGNCASVEQTYTKQLNLSADTPFYELRQLQRYCLYSLQLQACNSLGCSKSTILNERTNYTSNGDLLPALFACRVPKTMEYITHFAEPEHPNGIIVNYVLHMRNNILEKLVDPHLSCITRRAHEEANFVHVLWLNETYNECAVRVHSLAGDIITSYVPIYWCDDEQSKLPAKLNNHKFRTHTDNIFEDSQVPGHGISIFVVCFLFGCFIGFLWLIYKRRYWRQWPGLSRYIPLREQWLRERQESEDREILVDVGFQTVRFQNNNNNNDERSNDDY